MSIKVLNRDLWSNAGVKAIVGEHFVFWQQYKVSLSFWKFQTWWQNLLSEFNSQIPGKWWGCKIYDLLSNHWVAPCLNSWSKNRRKYGHMEQVKDPIFKWIVALWSICNINLFRLDAAAFPTLITEFLSLHPSLESPGKEEPPRKKVAIKSYLEPMQKLPSR